MSRVQSAWLSPAFYLSNFLSRYRLCLYRKKIQPALASQLAPRLPYLYGIDKREPSRAIARQPTKGSQQLDACTVLSSGYVPSDQNETAHNGDDGAILNRAATQGRAGCSSKLSANGD